MFRSKEMSQRTKQENWAGETEAGQRKRFQVFI
jgi:hypothetical protein